MATQMATNAMVTLNNKSISGHASGGIWLSASFIPRPLKKDVSIQGCAGFRGKRVKRDQKSLKAKAILNLAGSFFIGQKRQRGLEMSVENPANVDELLLAWRSGDETARDALFELLYSELRQISAALVRREQNASLSTGDLVNEAVLRIVHMDKVDWVDKAHFLALAARAMRRVLVDHARAKKADKRFHHKVTLITQFAGPNRDRIELDTLEKALIRLKIIDADKADIVELRYFGGLSLDEIALIKKTSSSTVKRNWRIARAWLLDNLTTGQYDDHGHA